MPDGQRFLVIAALGRETVQPTSVMHELDGRAAELAVKVHSAP
jgi:hypothetical protein